MTELKTLKELERYDFGVDGHQCPICNLSVGGHELNYCDCQGVEVKQLKQEAIKWIKELERKSKQHSYKYDGQNTEEEFHGIYISWIPEDNDVEGAIAFAKHFFNITKEELK